MFFLFNVEYCFENNTMYNLVNYSMTAKRSPVECQSLCQDNSTCNGFSYNFANGSCYQLATVSKPPGNPGAAYLMNWMSGPKFCNLPNRTGRVLGLHMLPGSIAERSNSFDRAGAIRVRFPSEDVFSKEKFGRRTKLKSYCLLRHMVINVTTLPII